MEQATFAELEHDAKKRRTRRELFLERMGGLVPWDRLARRIEPFHPKGDRGRKPYPLGTMLRVHCVQLFHNLSDPGMEDLLYEVESGRRFAGLRLTDPLPDETTILNFRHLLERHGPGEALFAEIRTRSASRCCPASPTCSSPAAMRPPDAAGAVRPRSAKGCKRVAETDRGSHVQAPIPCRSRMACPPAIPIGFKNRSQALAGPKTPSCSDLP